MTVYVVGAGLAGLSSALAAVDAGFKVELHESAGQAGGRCRSWHEPSLDEVIDNGTHMVLGGNRALFTYLRRIDAVDQLVPAPIAFPMIDLASGQRWTATPWRLLPSLIASLWRTRHDADIGIGALLGTDRNFLRFWEPVIVSVMNTPAEAASATVFRRVLALTLWRSLAASRPFVVRRSLSDTFVTPALRTLEAAGARIALTHPLRRLILSGTRVQELVFDDRTIVLDDDDRVVLALPWAVAAGMVPGLPSLPSSPIVNAHFRLSQHPQTLPAAGFVGLLGSTAQWLFVRGNILSVTVSAAGALAERSVEEIRQILWRDVAAALDLRTEPLAARVIKEKRATLFHTPEVEAKRPNAIAGDNLILAGDWTATGLPCTLEGAIHSGTLAGKALRGSRLIP